MEGLIEQPQIENANGSRLSWLQILTMMAEEKKLLLRTSLGCLILGVVLAFVLPVKYSSTVELLPPLQAPLSAAAMMSSQLGMASSGLSALTGGELITKGTTDKYIHILKSRPVVDHLIDRFHLMSVYRKHSMDDTRKALLSHTAIDSSKENFITIQVADKDRNRAAEMANAYVQELQILQQSVSFSEAAQRRQFFERQLADAKNSLADAEATFSQIQKSSHLIQLDAQARVLIENAASIQAQIAAKEVSLQAIRAYSTENNPQVQVLVRELSTLQNQLAAMENHGTSETATGIGLQDVPIAETAYARALRDTKVREALYEILLKQFEAAKLDEARESTFVQVLSPAIPAEKKSSPKRLLIIAAAAPLGLILGMLFILLKNWKKGIDLDPSSSRQFQELKNALWRKQ